MTSTALAEVGEALLLLTGIGVFASWVAFCIARGLRRGWTGRP